MTTPKSIALITMSVRTPRVGPSVSSFLQSILEPLASSHTNPPITLVPVDLATFSLPVYAESVIPAMVTFPRTADSPAFQNPGATAWSDEIRRHDGYVLVVPEYNYGMTGATKNAVDYLANEWKGKPVAVVSYGIQGGGLAGGQLREVLRQVGLRVVKREVGLAFEKGHGEGSDLFGAMLGGTLGEGTRGNWLKGGREEVEGAWGELVGLLFEESEGKTEGEGKKDGEE